MKHSICITTPQGVSYLSIRDRTAFSPAVARRHYLAAILSDPDWSPRLEDQFREEVPIDLAKVARRMESEAARLRELRLVDPKAPEYAMAEQLADNAKRLRRFAVRAVRAGLTR
jgi:hypothetical protein